LITGYQKSKKNFPTILVESFFYFKEKIGKFFEIK